MSWLQKILVNDQGKTKRNAGSEPPDLASGDALAVNNDVPAIGGNMKKIRLFNPDGQLFFQSNIYLDVDYNDPILIFDEDTDVIVGVVNLAPGQTMRLEE